MDDLDRWTRVLPLGTGAFGQVHLAWDTVAERWVAVKRFTGQDELGLLRFVIESRIRVEHPHLVRTLAFRLVDDRAWLVTELARGGSIRQLMHRSGPLPWGWVVEVVDQLLDALVALHATGVVHRDLKPANLLLRDAGAVRPHLLVGDFGIATWRTVSMTGIGAAIGTPGYLAPEYLDGSQPAPATDLFAVGVLAAELLAGRRLVHTSNASPAIPSDWATTLPLPDEVPTQVAAVLRRMADPDPARRYADCAQAREALLTAAPPGRRGELTTVKAADLLADLPSGWALDGPLPPDTPTTVTASGAADRKHGSAGEAADEQVPQPSAADHPSNAPDRQPANATSPATPPPGPTIGPSAGDHPASTTGQQPARPTTESPGPTTPPSSADHPADAPDRQPANATYGPTAGQVPPEEPVTTLVGHREPVTSLVGQTPTHLGTPPSGLTSAATAPPQARRAKRPKKKRRVRRFVLVLVLLLLLGGAGTLWVAAMTRTIPGLPTAGPGGRDSGAPPFDWSPAIVGPCSRAEISNIREGPDGRERCQRTSDGKSSWVREPEQGFPISNPNGPFPGETCDVEEDTDYSPVGERVICTEAVWTVTT